MCRFLQIYLPVPFSLCFFGGVFKGALHGAFLGADQASSCHECFRRRQETGRQTPEGAQRHPLQEHDSPHQGEGNTALVVYPYSTLCTK